jgi:hypothetical protein
MSEIGYTNSPIRDHFNLEKKIDSPTNASDFTIVSIRNQLDGYGILRLFWVASERLSSAGLKYNTHN